MHLPAGTIPLAANELATLQIQLQFWRELLLVPVAGDGLNVTLLAGPDPDQLAEVPPVSLGELEGYRVEEGAVARWDITNGTDHVLYVYCVTITAFGRLVIGPLPTDVSLWTQGIQPGGHASGAAFKIQGAGLNETRLISSRVIIPQLLVPPTTATRGLSAFTTTDGLQLSVQRFWFHKVRSHKGPDAGNNHTLES